MNFQSYYYLLLFLPIVFITYNFLNKNTLRNIVLILASYIFYAWGNPLLALLLLLSSFVDYLVGKKLRGLNKEIESNNNHYAYLLLHSLTWTLCKKAPAPAANPYPYNHIHIIIRISAAAAEPLPTNERTTRSATAELRLRPRWGSTLALHTAAASRSK